METTILFQMPSRERLESPPFDLPGGQDALDRFFDEECGGGENQAEELFWGADIQGSGSRIEILWLEEPADPQAMVDSLSKMLGVPVPPWGTWADPGPDAEP